MVILSNTGNDMVLKPCRQPGCPELTKEGYCEKHRPREQRPDKNERGYGYAWEHKIRPRKMRHNPMCERCSSLKHPVPATLVHHRDRNPRNNSDSNLESLCAQCHAREHSNDQ